MLGNTTCLIFTLVFWSRQALPISYLVKHNLATEVLKAGWEQASAAHRQTATQVQAFSRGRFLFWRSWGEGMPDREEGDLYIPQNTRSHSRHIS